MLAARVVTAGPEAWSHDDHVRPFLAAHCVGCHGGVKPKGDFRIEQLSPDFDAATSRDRWLAALMRVKAGEMPPKGKLRPPEKEDGEGQEGESEAHGRSPVGPPILTAGPPGAL